MKLSIFKLFGSVRKILIFTVLILAAASNFACVAYADENPSSEPERLRIKSDANLRVGPSANFDLIGVFRKGTVVNVYTYVKDGWSMVGYEGIGGFVKSSYLVSEEEFRNPPKEESRIELLDWWKEAKRAFTIGVNARVYDVRTGLSYYVRSFSNGSHADVEPVTKEDTAIMKRTYGGRWSWDPRPVFVTINGRTFAAAINGMPHGGGVNNSNGMNGQVCLHFRNSTTHNGNRSYERDFQAAVLEAWSAALQLAAS